MIDYIVEIEHVNKTFPGVKALDDVSFNLKSGRFLHYSGKTVPENQLDENTKQCLHSRQRQDKIFDEKVRELTPKRHRRWV